MVTSAAAAAEEAAVEDATLDAVELEEPPQAARPSAAAPTPAASGNYDEKYDSYCVASIILFRSTQPGKQALPEGLCVFLPPI